MRVLVLLELRSTYLLRLGGVDDVSSAVSHLLKLLERFGVHGHCGCSIL